VSEKRGPLALGIHWAHDAAVSVCTPPVGLDAGRIARRDELPVDDRALRCARAAAAGEEPQQPSRCAAHPRGKAVLADIDLPDALAKRYAAEGDGVLRIEPTLGECPLAADRRRENGGGDDCSPGGVSQRHAGLVLLLGGLQDLPRHLGPIKAIPRMRNRPAGPNRGTRRPSLTPRHRVTIRPRLSFPCADWSRR
jgi:hypothetical protein